MEKNFNVNDRTQKMLNLLIELKEEFTAEYESTPENEFAQDIETGFACHLSELCDDITALMGYNVRMNLNL